MAKVVVTGGLGFIGSHVADAYLARGDEVVIIDSRVASVTDGSEYDGRENCTVLRQSVEEYFEEGNTFEGVDRVIHAAALVGPAGILKYAGKIGSGIVAATQAVLDACIEADVPVAVFSSAEVYGRSGQLGEKDDIVVPSGYNARIEYAVGKTLTEVMTVNSKYRGLRGIVIRPFNVTGPRQSRAGGFVMPTFVEQALVGRPLTVFATGDQVRAFLSVTDLARFLTDYMDDAIAGPDDIFNIGNPHNATTVHNLAKRVKEMVGSDSEVIFADAKKIHGALYQEAESFEKVPVLSAAANVGWHPEVSLDALIQETIDHYRDHEDVRGANAPL